MPTEMSLSWRSARCAFRNGYGIMQSDFLPCCSSSLCAFGYGIAKRNTKRLFQKPDEKNVSPSGTVEYSERNKGISRITESGVRRYPLVPLMLLIIGNNRQTFPAILSNSSASVQLIIPSPLMSIMRISTSSETRLTT